MSSVTANSGQALFGFYEPPQSSDSIDQSPLRLPHILGKDELESYTHIAIDASHQLRLIELLPPKKASAGKNSLEMLRCKVHAPFLQQVPEYEALSYNWGQMDRNLPISVILDQSEEKALLVTPQLMMSLKRLRHPMKSRMLWIDQLCINQDNDDEKGPQIQLMGEIYRKAQRVIVWLGEDPLRWVFDPPVREVGDAELLADMISAFTEVGNEASSSDLKLAEHLIDVRLTIHLETVEKRRLASIYEMLKRPWFRRAWVFQEASLAHEILLQYGSLEMRFEDLKRLVDVVYLLESVTGVYRTRSLAENTPGFEMIQIIHAARQRLFDSGPSGLVKNNFLLTLLQVLRRVQAFDPRDFIFAFLAFQADEGITVTQESYRQTQQEVWRYAAERIIMTSKSLDIFAALSGDTKREFQLPSWVPFWSDCFPYSRPIATPVSKFRSSRGLPHIWKKSEDPNKLVVRGKIIDCIRELPWLAHGKFQTPEGLLGLKLLVQSVGRYLLVNGRILGDRLAVKQATLERDLMRTVLADGAMGSEQPLHCVYEMIDSIGTGDEARKLRAAVRKENLSEDQETMLSDYEKLENLSLVAERKRIFVTDNFQIGMAPLAIKVGDQIAIINGSKVPCVLRDAGSGSSEYRVISQCYLDGWMYGKSLHDNLHPHGTWWDEKEDEFVLV